MINRRHFLCGAGCAIALPYFESFGANPDSFKRMIILFSPNGMNMDKWNLTQGEGKIDILSPTLDVLKEHQNDIRVYSGLAQTKARANGDGGGDHARSMSTFLTGVQIKKTDGVDITAGISADQIAANYFKNQTRLPSLQLGCESSRTAGNCDSGYSCAYSSTISWANPHMPLPKDNHPASIFNRIYGDGKPVDKRKLSLKKSILDHSLEQANSLRLDLTGKDLRKLDEYLEAIRDLEKRIQKESELPKAVDGHREHFTDIPESFSDHAKMLIDLSILALQTDSTRIITIALANEGSNKPYKEIDISEGHHELSHHQNDEDKLNKLFEINKLHVKQVAYLFSALKKTNLLDSTLVAYGCGIEDGNSHRHHDLPIIVGGGAVNGGQHIVLPKETPLNNLWLGMLYNLGVETKNIELGDSTGIIQV